MSEVPFPEAPQPEDVPSVAARQASRLFILPAIIVGVVAVCLLIVGGLYTLLRESSDPASYLEQVVSGSGHRRWQAAYELSRVIEAAEGRVPPETAAALVDVFDKARADDPKVRRYLTLALGRVKDPRCVEALRTVAADPDVETRIYAIMGLGRQGDHASVPLVAAALQDADSGVRMTAAYTLGFIGDGGSAAALAPALADSDPLVRFNAAVAAAQLASPAGESILLGMLDADALATLTDAAGNPLFSGEQVRETRMTSIRALAGLGTPTGNEKIAAIAASDPDLRVRDLAIKALADPRAAAAAPPPPSAP